MTHLERHQSDAKSMNLKAIERQDSSRERREDFYVRDDIEEVNQARSRSVSVDSVDQEKYLNGNDSENNQSAVSSETEESHSQKSGKQKSEQVEGAIDRVRSRSKDRSHHSSKAK
jgi:hypothetical protein